MRNSADLMIWKTIKLRKGGAENRSESYMPVPRPKRRSAGALFDILDLRFPDTPCGIWSFRSLPNPGFWSREDEQHVF
jgi:hypothetical protein